MGYRAACLRALLPDDELERRLRLVPGCGSYAAAYAMVLFGRRSRLVLDSWTRPTYARLVRRASVPDLPPTDARRLKASPDRAR